MRVCILYGRGGPSSSAAFAVVSRKLPRSTTFGELCRGKDWRRGTRDESRLLEGATALLSAVFVTVCCVFPFI